MGQGSDIAMSVAPMTLMSSDLLRIADAIRLSADTVRTIRQNLFWAFIYNLISVPVAAGILYPVNGFLLNPMIAGAIMAMSSVSVVTNSLRLKKKKSLIPAGVPTVTDTCETDEQEAETPQSAAAGSVRKEYQVTGMMCHHCREGWKKPELRGRCTCHRYPGPSGSRTGIRKWTTSSEH